jgi:hypothetical protein
MQTIPTTQNHYDGESLNPIKCLKIRLNIMT